MAGLFIGIVLFFASITLPLGAESQAPRDLRVTDASGQVTLKTAEHSKRAEAVDEETPLAQEDVLETGPKSTAELTLNGESVFSLQPGSRLRIKYLYPQNTILELLQGILIVKYKPALHTDAGIFVKMPTALVATKHAEFVLQTGAGVSRVGIFDEGRAAVRGAWGHEAIVLAARQETKIPLSNVPQPPRTLNDLQSFKKQMPNLRRRVAFWHQHWKPMSDERRHQIRQRLSDPHRSKSQGFQRSDVHAKGPSVRRRRRP